MALYFDVLQASLSLAKSLDGFKDLNFAFRYQPSWVPLQDKLPMCVLSPRWTLAELIKDRRFEMGADVVCEVYFGILTPLSFGPDDLKWRLDRREELRMSLWVQDCLKDKVPGHFRTEYDPEPGVPPTGAPNVLETWQMFGFVVSTQGANG